MPAETYIREKEEGSVCGGGGGVEYEYRLCFVCTQAMIFPLYTFWVSTKWGEEAFPDP